MSSLFKDGLWTSSLSDDSGACHAESCSPSSLVAFLIQSAKAKGSRGAPQAGGNTHPLCAQRGQTPPCQLGCIMEEKRDSS